MKPTRPSRRPKTYEELLDAVAKSGETGPALRELQQRLQRDDEYFDRKLRLQWHRLRSLVAEFCESSRTSIRRGIAALPLVTQGLFTVFSKAPLALRPLAVFMLIYLPLAISMSFLGLPTESAARAGETQLARSKQVQSSQGTTSEPHQEPNKALNTEPFPELQSLSLNRSPTAIAWSPKGKFFATLEQSGKVTVFATDTWQVARELEGPWTSLGALAFSPNGRLLAAAGEGAITVWKCKGRWSQAFHFDRRESEKKAGAYDDLDPRDAGNHDVSSITFDARSAKMFVAGDGGAIGVWKTKDWKRDDLIEACDFGVGAIALTRGDKKLFAASMHDLVVRRWTKTRKTWKREADIPYDDKGVERSEVGGHTAEVSRGEGMSVDVSANGKLVAVGYGTAGGPVRVIAAGNGKIVLDTNVDAGYIPGVAFDRTGQRVCAASKELKVWQLPAGKLRRSFQLPAMALAMRAAPTRSWLAVSCNDRRVRIYDIGEAKTK